MANPRIGELHNTLYHPDQFQTYVNGTLWETYQTLTNKSGTTIPLAPRALPPSTTLARRDGSQDWPDYLSQAVICGDAVDDRNQTTTTNVFDEIVRVVKDVSPMCKKFTGSRFFLLLRRQNSWPRVPSAHPLLPQVAITRR
jgi:hypothetical protein